MNEQELLFMLEAAQELLAEGLPMHTLNERIRRETGGAIPGFMSLQLAIPVALRRSSANEEVRERSGDEQTPGEKETLDTFSSISPIRHFAESFADGVAMGFGGEIFGEEFAERADARQELNPGANLAGNAAGMLVPGAAVLKGARAGISALGAAGRGSLTRSAGILGGAAAGEGAVIGAGLSEEGERGKGALIGAAVSGPLGVAGPFAARATRPFQSNRVRAGVEGRNILAQTGETAENLFDEVRRRGRMKSVLGGVANVADVDKSIGGRIPGIVRLAPQIRRVGGKLEILQTRILPKQVEIARKGVWGQFDNVRTRDKAIIGYLKSNPEAREAARQVLKGNIEDVQRVSVPELQDIRRVMLKTAQRAESSGIRTEANAVLQSRIHLTNQMERIVPGYKRANQQWSEILSMQEGAEKFIEAVDKALPAFSPELPGRADGIVATVRETLSNSKDRRAMIAEMVGEAFLEPGESGIKRVEDLVKRGWYSRLFRSTVGEALGGSALGVPGLLVTDRSGSGR